MSFINRAEVSAAGVLGDSVALPAESAGVLGGINYVSAATGILSATPNDPVGPDDGAYLDAFRFNAFGQMFVWNFDLRGLPPGGVFYTGGLPFTKDGQLVVTAQPVMWYVGGWPIALNNYVVGTPTGGGSVPTAFTFSVRAGEGGPYIVIQWTASVGASIYEVRRDGVLILTVNAPALFVFDYDTPTLPGATWSYTVFAINGTGSTPSTSNPQLYDTYSAPVQPAAPVATAGDTTASIAFVPPYDGNDPILAYNIQAFINGITPGPEQQTTSPSPYTFTGLTNGTSYTFKISALNSTGESLYSDASNSVTPVSSIATVLFDAPLITTTVPTLATGSPTATYTGTTVKTFQDNLGNLGETITGECRFTGARRVRNHLATATVWNKTNTTETLNIVDPLGGTTARRITATASPGSYLTTKTPNANRGILSYWLRRRTGTGAVSIVNLNNVEIPITAQLDGTWRRFTAGAEYSGALNTEFLTGTGIRIATSGDAVEMAFMQMESLWEPPAPQLPSEYVDGTSHGVGGALDMQYFNTLNGNSINVNLVVEATGAPIAAATMKGYLAEDQRTNLCLNNRFFENASWSKALLTAADNTVMSPSSTWSTGKGSTLTATNTFAYVKQFGTVTNGQAYTFSVYLKRKTGTGVVRISANDGVGQKDVTAEINSTTWTRVQDTRTANSTTADFGIRIDSNGDELYAWGAQFELGTFPTSLLNTGGTAVTSNPDVLTYTSAGNIDMAVGSVSANMTPLAPTASVFRMALGTSSPTTYPLGVGSGTEALITNAAFANATTANVGAQNTLAKLASRWGVPNGLGVILNAGVIATNSSNSAIGTDGDNLNVGHWAASPAPLNGNMKNLKTYATPMSDAQMIAVTT